MYDDGLIRKMRCPIPASVKNMTFESWPAKSSIEAHIATRARISSKYDNIWEAEDSFEVIHVYFPV